MSSFTLSSFNQPKVEPAPAPARRSNSQLGTPDPKPHCRHRPQPKPHPSPKFKKSGAPGPSPSPTPRPRAQTPTNRLKNPSHEDESLCSRGTKLIIISKIFCLRIFSFSRPGRSAPAQHQNSKSQAPKVNTFLAPKPSQFPQALNHKTLNT